MGSLHHASGKFTTVYESIYRIDIVYVVFMLVWKKSAHFDLDSLDMISNSEA